MGLMRARRADFDNLSIVICNRSMLNHSAALKL